jgi:hypothetical protein
MRNAADHLLDLERRCARRFRRGPSQSLGEQTDERLLRDAGRTCVAEAEDEGGNHYYLVERRQRSHRRHSTKKTPLRSSVREISQVPPPEVRTDVARNW